MKKRKYSLIARIARVERKCDRILSELAGISVLHHHRPRLDKSIDDIVYASRRLSEQCNRELCAVKRLYSSNDIQP